MSYRGLKVSMAMMGRMESLASRCSTLLLYYLYITTYIYIGYYFDFTKPVLEFMYAQGHCFCDRTFSFAHFNLYQ